MCRHKRAIRGVALFTQLVNIPFTNNIHTFNALNIVYSDQLGILGSILLSHVPAMPTHVPHALSASPRNNH